MTDFAQRIKADRGGAATPLHVVDKAGFESWLQTRPSRTRALLAAQGFTGDPNSLAILPGNDPDDVTVLAGVANAAALGPWCLARAAEVLGPGTYRLIGQPVGSSVLGWLLAQHRFTLYRSPSDKGARVLLTTEAATIGRHVAEAEAVALVRDLVDTPAVDMGPQQLEDAAADTARAHGGALTVTRGAALDQGYPMIAAVGRAAASAYAPRLIEILWGDPAHPRVAIIGKGISFDSGGLDIKPASGMRLMKKDMGGAAHAIALARLIMEARLPVRLHLLVPAAENAISGNAFRPGDVLSSRKGLSVEVHNTDAEGRLVLADAITRALEDKPAFILDFATLTGASRVALGPDLPALFSNDDALAGALIGAGKKTCDPLWQLPLWAGYEDMLKSDIADIANASDSPFAGAVTAALFLQRFVSDGTPWAHIDTFAWMPADKPGRPRGGEALGLRAAWAFLSERYASEPEQPTP